MFMPHVYGLLIGIGVVLGIKVAESAQKKLSFQNSAYQHISVDDLILWVFPGAIIGARMYHVIDWWSYYQQHLIKIPAIWEGGLGIYGALIGGILALLVRKIFKKQNFKTVICELDVLASALPLIQAVGRVGNYANHELFGFPTTFPWAIYIPLPLRPPAYVGYSYFHPLFLYESLLCLGLFILLNLLIAKKLHPGSYFGIYLIGYSVIRFFLEFWRIDPWQIGVLTVAQWVSILALLSGLVLVKNDIAFHNKQNKV